MAADTQIEQSEQAKLAIQGSLLSYGKYMRSAFQAPKHLRFIAKQLERVERGECKRLILSCPPRHGKSYLCSELFPAWLMGKKPTREVIAISYAASLAHTFGGRVRALASSDRHKMVFPGCTVDGTSTSGFKWSTDEGGQWISAGVDGPVTGRGADFILIDDPIKNSKEARSKRKVAGLETYFSETLYTRLLPEGAIIITMTRWTSFDLVAYVLKEFPHENWEVINLEALCEDAELDPLGRNVGDALWPERYPVENLMKIKSTLKESFYALYQGHPVAAKGSLVKRDQLVYYSMPLLPRNEDRAAAYSYRFASIDTASTAQTYSDFTAICIWGLADGRLFLLDMVHEKLEFPELVATVKDIAALWQVEDLVIENASSGIQLIQTLSVETKLNPIKSSARGDYYSKLSATTQYLSLVSIPMQSEINQWVIDLVEELVTFPYAAHDDMVVAFVIGVLHWANTIRLATDQPLSSVKKKGYASYKGGGSRRRVEPGQEDASSSKERAGGDVSSKRLSRMELFDS